MVTHEVDKSSGKRNRCAWMITPLGLTDLKKWLKKPAKLKHSPESIVMKISGGAQQPPEQLIEHLQDYLKQIELAEDESEVVLEHAEQDYANSPSLPFVRINNAYGKEMLAARKKWAANAIEAIQKIK
jgi:DNA-binding PadR family transcriptional regulator